MQQMNKIDLFGSQILFRFKGKQTYQTKQGAFFTALIATIIVVRFIFMVHEIYFRKDPFVIYKERQVDSPSKFVMNKSTFQFAFGMQSPTQFLHYIDPQVYTVLVRQVQKTLKLNQATNKLEPFYETTYLDATPCTEGSFQNPKTRDYFLKLNYTNMYCINPKQEMYIEGDYNQDNYSYIAISVRKCKQNCKSDPELENLLQKAFFAIYYSDVLIDPQQKDQPFQYFTRDNYWMTSMSAPRDLSFEFRNTYIESDYGWLIEDIEIQHHAQQSITELTYLPSNFDKYFFQMVLRFEKQRENIYIRKYKTIMNIFSEIGGFTQTLLAIGFVLFSYFSKLQLNKEIINEAFNFENDEYQLDQSRKLTNQIKKLNQIDQSYQTPKNHAINSPLKRLDFDQNNFQSIQHIDQYNIASREVLNQSIKQINSPDSTIQLKQFNFNQLQPNLQQIELQRKSDKFSQNNLNTSLKQSSQQTVNRILAANETKELNTSVGKKKLLQAQQKCKTKIALSQIIQRKQSDSLSYNENIKQTKKQAISDTTLSKSKLLSIKKQVQLDDNIFKKMFNKATNSFSLNLLEYIKFFIWPFGEIKKKKRIFDYSVDKLHYHLDVLQVIKKLLEVDKMKRILFDQDQLELFEYLPKPTIHINDVFKPQIDPLQNPLSNQYEIQYQDKRTEIQKAQAAYQAFTNIKNKNNIGHLDQKILDYLDPNVLHLFTYNIEQAEQNINNQKEINLNFIPQQEQQIGKSFSVQNNEYEQKFDFKMKQQDRKVSIEKNIISNQIKDFFVQDDSQISEVNVPFEDLRKMEELPRQQEFCQGVHSKK